MSRENRATRSASGKRQEAPPPEPAPAPEGHIHTVDLKRFGFALAFIIGGLILIGSGLSNRRQATESIPWPTTPGVIRSTDIVYTMKSKSDSFDPRVTYTYTVAGATYRGDVIRFGGFNYPNRERAESKLAELQIGQTVEVRYDPKNPAKAVLESSDGEDWGFLVLLGIACGVAGIYIILDAFREH